MMPDAEQAFRFFADAMMRAPDRLPWVKRRAPLDDVTPAAERRAAIEMRLPSGQRRDAEQPSVRRPQLADALAGVRQRDDAAQRSPAERPLATAQAGAGAEDGMDAVGGHHRIEPGLGAAGEAQRDAIAFP